MKENAVEASYRYLYSHSWPVCPAVQAAGVGMPVGAMNVGAGVAGLTEGCRVVVGLAVGGDEAGPPVGHAKMEGGRVGAALGIVDGAPVGTMAQSAPNVLASHVQSPRWSTTPLPLQVTWSLNWHRLPRWPSRQTRHLPCGDHSSEKPKVQRQRPVYSATPLALQVTMSLYSHWGPVTPSLQGFMMGPRDDPGSMAAPVVHVTVPTRATIATHITSPSG